jgi:hypothetical protein
VVHQGLSCRVLRGSGRYVRPWSLSLLFCRKGFGLVASVVVSLMLAVLPYARGCGFVSRSGLLILRDVPHQVFSWHFHYSPIHLGNINVAFLICRDLGKEKVIKYTLGQLFQSNFWLCPINVLTQTQWFSCRLIPVFLVEQNRGSAQLPVRF